MVTSTKIHGKFDKNHSQFLAHGAAVDDHIGLLFDAYLVVPCLHMAKLGVCFCILCLFQELVGGKRMFLCFYVSRKRACGHPLKTPDFLLSCSSKTRAYHSRQTWWRRHKYFKRAMVLAHMRHRFSRASRSNITTPTRNFRRFTRCFRLL